MTKIFVQNSAESLFLIFSYSLACFCAKWCLVPLFLPVEQMMAYKNAVIAYVNDITRRNIAYFLCRVYLIWCLAWRNRSKQCSLPKKLWFRSFYLIHGIVTIVFFVDCKCRSYITQNNEEIMLLNLFVVWKIDKCWTLMENRISGFSFHYPENSFTQPNFIFLSNYEPGIRFQSSTMNFRCLLSSPPTPTCYWFPCQHPQPGTLQFFDLVSVT